MNLKRFLIARAIGQEGRRYKTVNVDDELHLFFKRTANHYNIALADLVFNVLSNWRTEYEDKIQEDLRKNLDG